MAPDALTNASGYGPSHRNRSAACAALPSCRAMLFVGQPTGRGAVAGQRERVGQARGQGGRPRIGGGPVQPRRPCGLATGTGRQIGELGGQPVVVQPVFGHSLREIR